MATIFHRPDLAQKIAELLLSDRPGSSAASGIFLAAPRRTGKSTFMREDLRPYLETKEVTVIYIDLWANKSADPGDVIISAILDEASRHDPVVKRIAHKFGVDRIKTAGVEFSLANHRQDISLTRALSDLSLEIKRPIVLMIDEAQHALTSQSGADALFALKAARDALNSSGLFGLRVLATGSNRDKLAMLRNSKDQAFFGAPLHNFPHLGKDYVAWFCRSAVLGAELDPEAIYPHFERAAFRPEIMNAAADAVRFKFDLAPESVPLAFLDALDDQIRQFDETVIRSIHALPPLQSAVLRVMAAKGNNYAPFEASTMRAYTAALEHMGVAEEIKIDSSSVQSALTALQDKGFVWREQRGVYALDEPQISDVMQKECMLLAD